MKKYFFWIHCSSSMSSHYYLGDEDIDSELAALKNTKLLSFEPVTTVTFALKQAWRHFIQEATDNYKPPRTWRGPGKPLPVGQVRAALKKYDAELLPAAINQYKVMSEVRLLTFSEEGYTSFILEHHV